MEILFEPLLLLSVLQIHACTAACRSDHGSTKPTAKTEEARRSKRKGTRKGHGIKGSAVTARPVSTRASRVADRAMKAIQPGRPAGIPGGTPYDRRPDGIYRRRLLLAPAARTASLFQNLSFFRSTAWRVLPCGLPPHGSRRSIEIQNSET